MKAIITKDAEDKLFDFVSNIEKSNYDYHVIQFNLSKLQEKHQSDYQLKVTLNVLNDVFKGKDSTAYITKEKDIFVVYQGDKNDIIEKAIFQIRYLFIDDPLAYDEEGFESDKFCEVFDLAFQWQSFFSTCRSKLVELQEPSHEALNTIDSLQSVREKLMFLGPKELVRVVSSLENINLEDTFRSQPICALTDIGEKTLEIIFNESYINIHHLQKLLDLNVDLLSSKILFKYLTKILDKKVLSLLLGSKNNLLDDAISINLNLKTLFTEEFAVFDAKIDNDQKPSIIFEINIADVFEDIDLFLAAKKEIQSLGYRICLDGLNSKSIKKIDRKSLGFDLAKLNWDEDMREELESTGFEVLKLAVETCGANRIILARCDGEGAITAGYNLGISLFQGRYLDNILSPESRVEN